jgi:cytochrome c
MTARIPRSAVVLIAAGAFALTLSAKALAVDADAAEELAQDNDCFKCHAIDKTKKGPAYKKIAAKYKGKEAEGEKNIIKNITTGPKVKLEDGTEEDHKIINTKDTAKIKNLVAWILSR